GDPAAASGPARPPPTHRPAARHPTHRGEPETGPRRPHTGRPPPPASRTRRESDAPASPAHTPATEQHRDRPDRPPPPARGGPPSPGTAPHPGLTAARHTPVPTPRWPPACQRWSRRR